MSLIIPDDIERRFRMRVLELRGTPKGGLSEAIAEAMELWLEARAEKPL